MADEDLNTAPVADDLHSTIAAAVEAQRTPEAPAKEPAKEAAVEPPQAKETASEDDGPVRDEKGRFAPKTAAELAEAKAVGADPAKPETAKIEPANEAAKEPAKTGTIAPPPGWSPAAKVEFEKLPEAVKEAVARREEEVNRGFQKYSGLDRYVQMAESNGKALPQVLETYVQAENAIRQDPFRGIDAILRNLGSSLQEFVTVYNQRSGTEGKQEWDYPSRGPQMPQIDPASIQSLARQAAVEQFEQVQAEQTATAFLNDPANRFAHNVRQDMAMLIQTGAATTLQDAYDRACWANPEIRAILINERSAQATPKPANTAIQAKSAAKAVTGAPSAGYAPSTKELPAGASVHDTVRAALAAQRGV